MWVVPAKGMGYTPHIQIEGIVRYSRGMSGSPLGMTPVKSYASNLATQMIWKAKDLS